VEVRLSLYKMEVSTVSKCNVLDVKLLQEVVLLEMTFIMLVFGIGEFDYEL
jgi:hypothetical protein